MAERAGRPTAAVWAIGVTLAMAALAWLLADHEGPRGRTIRLGVGEVVAVDPAGRARLRLVAVTTERDGQRALFFEPLPGVNLPVSVCLTEREPLHVSGRTVALLDVQEDSTRGVAVQLQWIPDDTNGVRPLFSVGEEPVRLPIDDTSFEISVIGTIPAPGGGPVTLEVSRSGEAPFRASLQRGGMLRIGGNGALTWIGTRERLLARIEIH